MSSLLALYVLLAGTMAAQTVPKRRALLIGINDYTASRLGPRKEATPPARDWPNLKGAANDAAAMEEMLVLLYGFDRNAILKLTDQAATRAAILQTLELHLVKPAAKGDILLFYFAGHGSQVRNSLSEEPDKLDESIVPADSRAGARDIRDKELQQYFNRILDRGARLSVILDNCHSGSGARGLSTGATPRGVEPDLRDVADRTASPRPEDRGALVLSGAQDYDKAWEVRGADGKYHGAFSWAWMRAMRDSSAGESAIDTFLRAQARLRGETPFQEPVLAGNVDARRAPFLGTRIDRSGDRTVIAVEKVQADGTIVLQGGWANGLSVGSELRLARDPDVRLTVAAMRGLGRSTARLSSPRRANSPLVRAGALLELSGWTVPASRPLRVWMPRVASDVDTIAALARAMATAASQRDVHWVTDPVAGTPTHLLRRRLHGWELLAPNGRIERLGDDANALAAISNVQTGASLFVQFPASTALSDGIAIVREGIEVVDDPEDADYILVGRYSSKRLAYAWLRPSVKNSDRRKTGLPLRTMWVVDEGRDTAVREMAPGLRHAVLRLRRIHGWHLLESAPEARSLYRLGIRRARNGAWATESIIGQERYDFVLRATPPIPQRINPRHVYVFTIDSHGKSVLLFPRNGPVENRFPVSATEPPPVEIPLGEHASFIATAPYGVDTYFLLTTDEQLPNPFVLEWDAVRGGDPEPTTPLGELLKLTAAGMRARTMNTPSNWSIEKIALESVRPPKNQQEDATK
ncbi:MAG TPA: caspase family protein [Thermoanaerobaculia bacterium]|nr:caspase family protein [Thermoanaerobaculia bacterium]